MITSSHIVARWPRHASFAVATGLMALAAVTTHSPCFRPRKNLQKRINRSSSITQCLSLIGAIESHQVLKRSSQSQRRAVVCEPPGMMLVLHCSRQSINPPPSSPSIHLQVHPLLLLKTSPLFISVPRLQNCACSSHSKQVESRLIPFLRTADGASAFTSLLRSDRWKSILADSSEKNVGEKLVRCIF